MPLYQTVSSPNQHENKGTGEEKIERGGGRGRLAEMSVVSTVGSWRP